MIHENEAHINPSSVLSNTNFLGNEICRGMGGLRRRRRKQGVNVYLVGTSCVDGGYYG